MTKPSSLRAVLTGDVVRSTGPEAPSHEELISALATTFRKVEKDSPWQGAVLLPFAIYRGDSFQGVLAHPDPALAIALYLRSSLLAELNLGVRIAIGIGRIEHLDKKSPHKSSGEAFVSSGRSLDKMRKRHCLTIDSSEPATDDEFNTCFALLDALVDHWTEKEAEAIAERLTGLSQTEIAARLGVTQGAISQRLKRAGWFPIELLLARWTTRFDLHDGARETK